MKKINLAGNVSVVSRQVVKGKLDYYLVDGKGNEYYAFRQSYSKTCYDLTKGGISANKVAGFRSRNKAVMNFVSHYRYIVSYLDECYGLSA